MHSPIGFGVMEGVDADEAWALYSKRQNEIEEAGESLIERFKRKPGGGWPHVLRHGAGARLLSVLAAERPRRFPTVLYVHCHGNAEVVGFRPLKLSPQQLAQRLESDGLPHQSLEIKLWSCHSGEAYAEDDKTFLVVLPML